ncbi:hypothetical protein SAMN05216480_101276 [Pustulibacterium marinum]|uniref:Uncharacterized protein n=1 Tax=Pustulibacterium marinum TaxID=1224947 RepID=A0A1I7EV16_9FLAO|nr:hypothetical protein [Pustulibacterium marinum]SFU27785.1 hypothetical protein SAMN05216480_101276 [Pustulibacterium marinum]
MIKKEIAIGFIVGLIANSFGIALYILIFLGTDIFENIMVARQENYFSKIVALGAILNMLAFFGFLKIKRDYRARGVLLATIIIAIFTFFEQFIF